MPKIVSPKRLGSTLNEVVMEFGEKSEAKINKGIRSAVIKTWGDIIRMTPVDEGRARGNWFVDSSVKNISGQAVRDKGASYVASRTRRLDLLRQKLFLFNNLPYIRKLEYGGYSTKNAGRESSKVTTRGFSKQAPKGMVRLNLLKWRKNLRNAIKAT